MLRFYQPFETNDIFELHSTLEHLVCEVWHTADDLPCESKINLELQKLVHYIYKPGVTFQSEIARIYNIFKATNQEQKDIIYEAFKQASEIEKLCNKSVKPITIDDLPDFVEKDIKPLFKWCYEDLLDKQKVGGDKLKYYKDLITKNGFLLCPSCGLIDFESEHEDNEVREAYDHYLPKSIFPFASVSFKNLVPLCYKCNSDRKKAKNPIESDRKAFYPFSINPQTIGISLEIDEDGDLDNFQRGDLKIIFTGPVDEVGTWDWLFGISTRYNDTIRGFSKSFLRRIKRRHDDYKAANAAWSYIQSLEKLIDDYKYDEFEDKKFLKIPFMQELKNLKGIIEVYE